MEGHGRKLEFDWNCEFKLAYGFMTISPFSQAQKIFAIA